MLNISHLFLRIGLCALMLVVHGLSKWQKLLSQNDRIDFPFFFGLSSENSLLLAAFIETLFPLMIVLGIATRFSSVVLIVLMSVILFDVHGQDPFYPKQELALIYLLGFVCFLLVGNGKYALRHRLFPKIDNNILDKLIS